MLGRQSNQKENRTDKRKFNKYMLDMKKSFLFFTMLFLSITSYAYDIAIENADGKTIYYNYSNNGQELEVTKGNTPYSGVINIPEAAMYMNRTRSVTSIGKSAFHECENLTSVSIPNNVTIIGDNAFEHCWNLNSVTIPNSVTSIGNYAFDGCVSLSSLTFPDNVTYIGESAFRGCQQLTSVAIPNSITSISKSTFDGCKGLLSVSIPNSVTSIGKQAFLGCTSLTTIKIPSSVTSIGTEAFYHCKGLTSLIIPNSVISIGKYAFGECSNLTYVTIGNSVTSIGTGAFSSADIPTVISYIEDPFELFNGFSQNTLKNATLYVPEGSIEKYKETDGWKDFLFIETITELESRLFKLTYTLDGEEYKVHEVKYGTYITPENAPEREGYTFSGWSGIPETMPPHDITVTGSFVVNTYTLTYMVDGEVYKTCQVDYGTTITPEESPAKTGYTFSGWDEVPSTMPAKDVTVNGTFAINSYMLIYLVDGEEYKTFEIVFDTAIIPEVEPTKEGYTFSGWSDIPETMPANDVTVIGSFIVNKYQVTYIIDGEVFATDFVEYGTSVVPPNVEEKEGFTFSGWADVPETMPAHNITIYGSFTSGIAEIIMANQRNIRIYSPNGKRTDRLQKGLNIVILDDGTVRKVMVK